MEIRGGGKKGETEERNEKSQYIHERNKREGADSGGWVLGAQEVKRCYI